MAESTALCSFDSCTDGDFAQRLLPYSRRVPHLHTPTFLSPIFQMVLLNVLPQVLFALVFPVALPNHSAVFIGAVPYLAAESASAISAYQLGRERADTVTVFPVGFPLCHFCPDEFPLIFENNRRVAVFNDYEVKFR